MKSNLFEQSDSKDCTAVEVALGNFLAKRGQWKSSSLSDHKLSSSQSSAVSCCGFTNMGFASLHAMLSNCNKLLTFSLN